MQGRGFSKNDELILVYNRGRNSKTHTSTDFMKVSFGAKCFAIINLNR